jgi:hypothetical protein
LSHYLKQKIAGTAFKDMDELVETRRHEWAAIPDTIIEDLSTSFRARLVICVEISGDYVNGHWRRLHILSREGETLPMEPLATEAGRTGLTN